MKFRAIHLLSNPQDERERRSYAEVSQLSDYDIPYISEVNPTWTGDIPPHREASDRPFLLTPSHYGCYKAHKDAIMKYLTTDIDALLLFECDAIFSVSIEEMSQRITRAWWACMEGNLDVFTFGPKHNGKTIDTVGDDVIVITQFIETHAYMIPLKSLPLFRETFAKPWDALDYVYTIYLYDRGDKRIGTFKDRAVACQATGKSLITGKINESEKHWRYKKYE